MPRNDLKRTIKRTEKELPLGWALATITEYLGQDGIFADGDWVESKDQDPDGDVRLVQLADIGDGYFKDRSSRYLTRQKAEELNCTYLKANDTLVARMPDPLGRACVFPGDAKKAVTAVDICIIRTGYGAKSQRWLMHWINSPYVRRAIAELQSGTTRKRISRRNLAKLLLPIPPLSEQERIVDEIETQFARLDTAVADLRRLQHNLDRYRASVLKAAFEGRLVPQDPADEPAEQLLQRILAERRRRWEEQEWQKYVERAQKKVAQARRKAAGRPARLGDLESGEWQDVPEEEYRRYLPKGEKWKEKYEAPDPLDLETFPGLPSGWVWTTVGQLAEILGGLTKNSTRQGMTLKLPYLRVANVYANELRLDEVSAIGVTEDELNRILVEERDLLIVEGNGSVDQIGRVAIWDGSISPIVHQNHLIKARLFFPEMAEFVLYWLLSDAGRAYITQVASSTSGLYTLSLSKVALLPIPLAPLAEQCEIVQEIEQRLSIVDQLIETVQLELIRAERLRQSILEKAFTGRLVPQDPDEEPAEKLLERIRAARSGERSKQLSLFHEESS